MKDFDELERNFLVALRAFAAGDDAKRDGLFIAYHKLTGSVNDDPEKRNRKLSFIFSALIESLDNAEGEIATTLYHYTFGDFLEYYGEKPVIRSTIRDYLDHNRLSKLPLYIALGRRINND